MAVTLRDANERLIRKTMADHIIRPVLPLPAGQQATFVPRSTKGGGQENQPNKNRVLNRLNPKFEQLQRVLDARQADLADHASGASPEQILVFETTSAGTAPFIEALGDSELDWLAGYDRDDVEPDDDFFNKKDSSQLLTTRLFLVMANVAALNQLLKLWNAWVRGGRGLLGLGKHRAWGQAFRYLRDVRYWGPQDRVAETGLLECWRERTRETYPETVPVEIELWFRDVDTRSIAEARVCADVVAAGGTVVHAVAITPIAYHAVLAELPITVVEELLHDRDVALIRSHDVHLVRPVPQQPPRMEPSAPSADAEAANLPRRPATGPPPTVALLDGLPLQRHSLLDDRLVVHDPDDYESDYPSAARCHGTAMASLILHGDLGDANDPAPRPLFVQPILQPAHFGSRDEQAPTNRLWVDVIHCAVLGLVGADEARAAAPEVRIVNLSVGDQYRPFLREMSPLARLLDWLAWKYKLLFVVSAGNHQHELTIEHGDDALEHRALQAMRENHRHRRLLSPAESINALTVGARPLDAAGDWQSRNNGDVELIRTTALPSPISALGRGFRGAVKPELLAPGGRAVFARSVDDPRQHTPSYDRARIGPGQRAAAPGNRGDLGATEYSIGTSNSAALVSRAAMQVLEIVRDMRRSTVGLGDVPEALLVKSLLVHTSTWDPGAFSVLADAVRSPHDRSSFRDHATAFLGYGSLRAERALECALHRATLVGGGELELESAAEHRIPVPAALNAYTGVRRVVVTLAWFSPVRPSHRNYRVAALEAGVSGLKGLGVDKNNDAHASATKRGTVQHRVHHGERSAVFVGLEDELVITVRATSDAPGESGTRIPYALAVTVEVDPQTPIPIYDEVVSRLRTRVQTRGRSS